MSRTLTDVQNEINYLSPPDDRHYDECIMREQLAGISVKIVTRCLGIIGKIVFQSQGWLQTIMKNVEQAFIKELMIGNAPVNWFINGWEMFGKQNNQCRWI